MIHVKKVSLLLLSAVALSSCAKTTPPASDTTAAVAIAAPDVAADEQAIRAINPVWFKAHQDGNVEGIVALYADDAVLSVPGDRKSTRLNSSH